MFWLFPALQEIFFNGETNTRKRRHGVVKMFLLFVLDFVILNLGIIFFPKFESHFKFLDCSAHWV